MLWRRHSDPRYCAGTPELGGHPPKAGRHLGYPCDSTGGGPPPFPITLLDLKPKQFKGRTGRVRIRSELNTNLVELGVIGVVGAQRLEV